MPLSTADFAARVKAKHPEYADVPDDELVKRVVAKYPEYADQVEPDVATKARQHLAGIAAGTDVPPGAPRPFAPDDSLSYNLADTSFGMDRSTAPGQATDKAGNVLPQGGTARTAGDALKDAGKGAITFAASLGSQRPDLIAENIVAPAIEGAQHEGRAAKAAWNRPGIGGKVEAGGHALAAALPLIGPAAAAPAEDFAAGDLGAAAGGATALVAPAAIGKVLPAAVRGVAGSADAAGTALRAAGDRLGVPLFDAEGKFTPQAEALVKELHDQGLKITDPKAQAQAMADAVRLQAEDAGAKVTGGKMQDMADALPETQPLNAGKRVLGIAARGAGDYLAHEAGVSPVVTEMAMQALPGAESGGALVQTIKLARDIVKSGAPRKWGSNTLAKWGNALKADNPGALAAAASEGDQIAAGINDPAYGAVSHLGADDLAAIYQGAPALYVDPSGKVHELHFGEEQP